MKYKLPSLSALKLFDKYDYIAAALAILLQIQVTLFADITSKGIRIGLADLVLPVLGGYIVFSLFRKKSKWPQWAAPSIPYWIISMALVMSVALLNGYLVNGVISSWALLNKYIGFYILISYMLAAGWLVTNAPDRMKVLSTFITVFVSFFVITLCTSVMTFFIEPILGMNLWLPNYPWDGFMANRNAFMVIFTIAFVLIIWGYKRKDYEVPSLISSLFFLCLPIFFVLNDSRTGWIVGTCFMLIFLFRNPIEKFKFVLPLLCVGATIAYSSYFVTTSVTVQRGHQMRYFVEAIQSTPEDELKYRGDQKRYTALEDGLELYRKYNPIVGAGLGSYKPFQIKKRGKFIDIIDFTGLWLLVETGIIGLSVFSAFFIFCLWSLYKSGFRHHDDFARALFTFLIFFAGMTLLHELIYTRVVWFILGSGFVQYHSNSSNAA